MTLASIVPTRENGCVVCGSIEAETIASGTDYQYRTTEQCFDWRCCESCAHLYINPLPTEAALPMIYPDTLKNYDDFDAHPGVAFRVKNYLDGRALASLTKQIAPGGRLLDVGCAAGMLLDAAKRHCPNIEVLEGLEISDAAAAGARRKGYKIRISTIEAADLPLDYFDIIVLQQVIEHVHNPHAVLCKLRAALKRGGQLVMETPNLGSWDHYLFRKGYWEGYHIPRHFNLWTNAGMRRMVEAAGFSGMSLKKRIKPVHWTISLQNWAIGERKSDATIRFFDLRNPVLLFLFAAVDVVQLILFRKASDVQYVATR